MILRETCVANLEEKFREKFECSGNAGVIDALRNTRAYFLKNCQLHAFKKK